MKTLDYLREQMEYEGFIPGTPHFEREFTRRRITKCQEHRHVAHCKFCKAFDVCSLAKEFLIRERYKPNQQSPAPPTGLVGYIEELEALEAQKNVQPIPAAHVPLPGGAGSPFLNPADPLYYNEPPGAGDAQGLDQPAGSPPGPVDEDGSG